MQKTVALISFHHYLSKRKAGFHWIAHSFEKLGWDVIFITAPLSPFSRIIHDYRWDCISDADLNKVKILNEHISIYTHSPVYSPLSKTGYKLIDLISPFFIPIYKNWIPWRLEKLISGADILIFESTAAILMFDSIKKINPGAKYIYRVSDSLDILKVHSSVLEYERVIAPDFDLISVPSRSLLPRFPNGKTCLQHHGINKNAFSESTGKPETYKAFENNAVFVGNSFFDLSFITVASRFFPRTGFHLIGPIDYESASENVILYGEIPFFDTIPYISHADIGLQIRRMDSGLDTLSDSLKILQYTWCQLPIIAPLGLNSDRKHILYYEYDNPESIQKAMDEALAFDRLMIDRSDIMDWEELTREILRKIDTPAQ